jgi:cell division protein FtsW (lipid II flippase)
MKPSIVLTFAVIGILMGASAVMGLIQPRQETFISIVIALGGALWISGAPHRRFLTGFLSGLLGGMLSLAVEAVFIERYIAHNPEAARAFATLPKGMSARVLCLVISPFYGALLGVALGFLSWLAGKLRPKPAA